MKSNLQKNIRSEVEAAIVLYIKNMVCKRCVLVVRQQLELLDIAYDTVRLGEVQLTEPLSPTDSKHFEKSLLDLGFELIDDRKDRLIQKVKLLIIELIQNKDAELESNLSDYIIKHITYDYQYLSNIFSEVEGITIEKYYILQKIEKVKELLIYNELTLTEIANLLNYSSVAYLSSQFKKITGLSPSVFKKDGIETRKPLDEV